MEKLLIVAALARQPGDRAIDLSGKQPRGLQYMDFIVSVAWEEVVRLGFNAFGDARLDFGVCRK